MRSTLLLATIIAFLFPVMLQAQAGKKMDIEISSAVLKTAEWASFKYMEHLDLAQTGDQRALKEFLEFSGTVDGAEAIQHAVTCIELIPLATDEKMGAIIYILKPKLQSVLLERFQLAIGKTKKEELRRPLEEWAPLTWKGLHGERVLCSSCLQGGGITTKPGAKSATSDTELSQPSGTIGKQ